MAADLDDALEPVSEDQLMDEAVREASLRMPSFNYGYRDP